jgi:hypothetical protein
VIRANWIGLDGHVFEGRGKAGTDEAVIDRRGCGGAVFELVDVRELWSAFDEGLSYELL